MFSTRCFDRFSEKKIGKYFFVVGLAQTRQKITAVCLFTWPFMSLTKPVLLLGTSQPATVSLNSNTSFSTLGQHENIVGLKATVSKLIEI